MPERPSPPAPQTALPPRRHPALVRLLVVLASSLLALAGAELVVRLSGTAPEVSPVRRGRFQLSDNPRLVFEPVPGLAVERRDEGGVELYDEYPGTANRLGYRDRDHPVEKPPGTFRIVVLGDSIAAGWGVDDTAATFPFRVEEALESALPGSAPARAPDGPPDPSAAGVEVLNFAVTGYNTAQEVETLASRALPFDPDLVLLAYCLNDRRPPDPRLVEALREVAAKPGTVAPSELEAGARRLLFRSALYRLLRFRLLDRGSEAAQEAEGVDFLGGATVGGGKVGGGKQGEGAAAEPATPFGADPAADLASAPEVGPDGEPISGAAGVAAAFARLARLADGGDGHDGFRVLVVVFPHQRTPYRFYEHHQHVATLAAEHGFALLDLTEAFQECRAATDRPLAFDRYHPTALGHRCAAAAISEHLLESPSLLARPVSPRPAPSP